MQIVNGFVCMNCTDVDHAKKFIDPAHPNQVGTVSGLRDAAKEASSPTSTLTENAVSFRGSLSHLNALDTKRRPDPILGPAGASLDIFA
ncbi:hypothetical protein [Bradyrhizobium lablabi]|uniref:hypothetical protein n=1 Tax=Bradyrhizobium lablabi TaxID=722472 RepID=UPI000A6BF3CC|nr:hypothetical protein [Bradyrhizobium lablabi]